MQDGKTETIVKEEKTTTIKEIPSTAANVSIINKKVYPVNEPIVKIIQKYLPKGSLYAGKGNGYVDVPDLQVIQDKKDGILYWETSYTLDKNTTLLDLSDTIGKNKSYIVRLYVKIIDYGKLVNCTGYSDGKTTNAVLRFSTPGTSFTPIVLNQRYENTYSCVDIITDSKGCINVQFDTTSPYDAISEAADPGVHIYQWIKCQLWVYAKWDVSVL
jgi:hypothetical protein